MSDSPTVPKSPTLLCFKRMWQEYVRFFRPSLSIAIFFMLLYAGANTLLPILMKPVIDDVFKNEDLGQLYWVSSLVLVAFVVKGIAFYGEMVSLNYVGQSVITRIQKQLFRHLLGLDLKFFYQHSAGKLVSLGTYHITMIKNTLSNTLLILGKDIFTLIGLIIVLFYQDPWLATIALFIMPLAAIPLSKLGKRMRRVSGTTQDFTGEWVAFMTQIFQGIRIVKSYTMEEYEQKRSASLMDRLLGLSLRAGKIRSLASPIMEVMGGFAVVIIISYGGWQVIHGTNTAGAFFSFITALLLSYAPMKRLSHFHANLQEGMAALQEVFAMLDLKPSIVSAANAPSLDVSKGQIELKNITFAYEDRAVLHDVTLTVPGGKTVALVGPSGAGKSTIFNLLLRFFDPQEGGVSVDGQKIPDVTLSSLRHQIGMVSQEVTLFDDTVEENIRYGKPDATHDEIVQAAHKAAAHGFIEKLPEGYQTMVGEMGVKLSGGQRQRIAIARAFLKNAPILLLDEATSALDTESEQVVHKALKLLMANKTCIVIAHRLSTVQDADLIYVLDDGKIVESGTHQGLLKKGGMYKHLCQAQLLHHA